MGCGAPEQEPRTKNRCVRPFVLMNISSLHEAGSGPFVLKNIQLAGPPHESSIDRCMASTGSPREAGIDRRSRRESSLLLILSPNRHSFHVGRRLFALMKITSVGCRANEPIRLSGAPLEEGIDLLIMSPKYFYPKWVAT